MRIIDFHLHLSPVPDVIREKNISQEKDLAGLLSGLSLSLQKNKIEKGLLIVLDESFLEKGLQKTLTGLDNLLFAFIIDFRKSNCSLLLEKACSLASFRALKFHPVHQDIQPSDFKQALELAQKASEAKKIIIIDCHSTRSQSQELEFARYVLEKVKTPVVLAHSGGLKALEALVLALDFPNAYLETSFSVPFWAGSSVESDLAFAFKKLGASRCLYGSDSPYVPLAESLKKTLAFFKKYKFTSKEQEQIMSKTALGLIKI